MEKFGSYILFKKESLIVEYHSGDINVNDFIHSREIISADGEYSPDFDLILDFRQANMSVQKNEIELFVDYFKNKPSIQGRRKSAYLTKDPKQVVITTLFASGISGLHVRPKTFSTLKSVVNWLGKKDLDTLRLRDIIDELRAGPNIFYK